jgi:hypothetical protein
MVTDRKKSFMVCFLFYKWVFGWLKNDFPAFFTNPLSANKSMAVVFLPTGYTAIKTLAPSLKLGQFIFCFGL